MESAVVERKKSVKAKQVRAGFTTNGDYEKTRQDITALLYVPEDEDFVRPTRYALDLTLNLLENANAELVARGVKFPRGTASTSEKGGLYVFWEGNNHSLQLEVPPVHGGLFYLHLTNADGSLINKDVSAKTLADALTESSLFSSQRPGPQNASASAAAR